MVNTGASRVNEFILRYADSRSLREIAQMLGGAVSVEALAKRADALFDSRDWLSDRQREKRILLLLEETLAQIDEQSIQDKDLLKIRLSYIKTIMDQLDRRKSAVNADIIYLTRGQGIAMIEAFDRALTFMRQSIATTPEAEVTEERWDELQIEALEHSRESLARYEIEQ